MVCRPDNEAQLILLHLWHLPSGPWHNAISTHPPRCVSIPLRYSLALLLLVEAGERAIGAAVGDQSSADTQGVGIFARVNMEFAGLAKVRDEGSRENGRRL